MMMMGENPVQYCGKKFDRSNALEQRQANFANERNNLTRGALKTAVVYGTVLDFLCLLYLGDRIGCHCQSRFQQSILD